MARGMTSYEGLERDRSFEDDDGARAYVKTDDEVLPLGIDWSDVLDETGETISTSTWTDDGVETSTPDIDGLTTTCLVTGTGGQVVNKITTSLGATHQRVRRFYEPEWAP